jgi:hypothetical protein
MASGPTNQIENLASSFQAARSLLLRSSAATADNNDRGNLQVLVIDQSSGTPIDGVDVQLFDELANEDVSESLLSRLAFEMPWVFLIELQETGQGRLEIERIIARIVGHVRYSDRRGCRDKVHVRSARLGGQFF